MALVFLRIQCYSLYSTINLPNKQRKRAESHIYEHREQLLVMWNKAVNGENPGKLGDEC